MSEQQTLTIRDQLNYPYLLAQQIQALIDIQKKETFTAEEIKIPVDALRNLIPSPLEDEAYREELKKAVEETSVDIRPSFAGSVMDEETCHRLGIASKRVVREEKPLQILKAIMNLLNRRGMITKKNWIEEITGFPFNPEELDTKVFQEDVHEPEAS